MPGPQLYSTNCWLAYDICTRYRRGKHYVWCSEHFDHAALASSSPYYATAPSSSPRAIYEQLHVDSSHEDGHSALIKRLRRTFVRLAAQWLAAGEVTTAEHDEIIALAKSRSWRIWRPVLYIIPRAPIELAGRLEGVPRPQRAAYGPELRIVDLDTSEFDAIEFK